MPEITPIELDQLQYDLENGRPLNRELVARLYMSYYRLVKDDTAGDILPSQTYNLPKF
jgi:hypothetical protein